MSESNNQVRRDWITRTPKWVLLSAFWIIQGIVLYATVLFIGFSQADVGDGESLLGKWPRLDEYLDVFTDLEAIIWIGGAIMLFTTAQMFFLIPVRQPGNMGKRGHGLRLSMAIAGLIIALLSISALFAVGEFASTVLYADLDWIEHPDEFLSLFFGIILLGWIVVTPILFRFTKPGRKEDALARVSKKLFLGTIIEVALLIPLDVMVRKKTDCYCSAGTFWALNLCGFVGVFALGPAVFLPILAKRRKTWYSGHCGVCGYDMIGRMNAPRCPECGTGWKEESKKPRIETQ